MGKLKTRMVKKGKISEIDKSQIEEIYRVKAQYVNGVYMTPAMHTKSTTIRLTFCEYNFTLGRNIAVCAVSMSLEDLQSNYNAMTELLQQMRTMGRID